MADEGVTLGDIYSGYVELCSLCAGGGLCARCDGKGRRWTRPCPSCGGSKVCRVCLGVGEVAAINHGPTTGNEWVPNV